MKERNKETKEQTKKQKLIRQQPARSSFPNKPKPFFSKGWMHPLGTNLQPSKSPRKITQLDLELVTLIKEGLCCRSWKDRNRKIIVGFFWV